MKRVSRGTVLAVAAFFGALIWILSPAISGALEPWDAAAPYYMFALLIAGFLSGFLTGRPLWAQYAGAIAGQFIYGLAVLSFGPLILLGVSFLAVYGLLFLAGSFLGLGARLAMVSKERRGVRAAASAGEGMQAPGALTRYDGQSLQELLALREAYDSQSILLALEEGLQQRRAALPLSPDEHHALAAIAFERETRAGGFGKFMRNTSTELLQVVVAALNGIDCPKAALVCQDAIDAVGSVDSPWRIEQALANLGVRRRLAECDALLQGNDEDIGQQVLRWIDEHPGKIRLADHSTAP